MPRWQSTFNAYWVGYAITGDVSQEIFPIFTGSGRNCKGLLTQTLMKIMGPFYVEMNVGMICERQVSNLDAERGKLFGSRIAVFNELNPGEKLKTNEVQLLSGGDGITAKPLYRDPMTIIPRHLCILATNHMPQLSQVIPAIVERLICINFPVRFTDLMEGEEPTMFKRQADKGLKTYLDMHKSEVLTWLVQGSVAWYSNPSLKTSAPAKVVETSQAYFSEQDKISRFIMEECVLGEDFKVATNEFLRSFNSWAEEGGYSKADSTTMSEMMRNKGYVKKLARLEGHPKPKNVFLQLKLKPSIVADDMCNIP